MQKLISIELKADFGFFRKPDTNSSINLSYNMLHKPALLGILGAIIGLEGYTQKGVLPQYYLELEHLKLGIEPLQHEKGNFQKTAIKYTNTVGYANKGATFLTEEATLVAPAFRCYILLDMSNDLEATLYNNLKKGHAEYLPYFGKNEFAAWWNSEENEFTEYEFEIKIERPQNALIKTLFRKQDEVIKDKTEKPFLDIFAMIEQETPFLYFERLPIGIDKELYQYQLGDFVFTTFHISPKANIQDLYYLKSQNYYVQLF